MAVAVVDSNVLIGTADAGGQHHETATEIVQGIDHGDLPAGRVTNYVLLETLNWIHARQRHAKAIETHARLNQSAGFEVLQAAQKDFNRAVELFETYEGLAFGDATIVAYMQREGIEYLYSFDEDFDAIEGITRLDSANAPFN